MQIIAFACLIAITAADRYADRNAKIKSYTNIVNADGTYQWQFETDNQIYGQEAGAGGVIAQGTAHWFAPDGQAIHLTYTADQNGYHPVGDHLPTPPPTPDHIVRALQYLKEHAPKRPDESL